MLNLCEFIGRLGSDPTVREAAGNKVAQFNIACDEREYTKRDGTKVEKRTEWVPCVLWRGLADTAEKFLHKGDLVYIRGRFRTRSYEDNSGTKRYATEIVADDMQMLGSRREQAPAPIPVEQTAPAGPRDMPPANDGDLPF